MLGKIAETGLSNLALWIVRFEVFKRFRDRFARLLVDPRFLHFLNQIEIRMVQGVDSIQTIFLDAKHPWDEIFSLARYTMPDRSWEIQIVLDDGSVELLTNTSIVGRLARQKHVEDYSDRPNVALLGVNATQNFWGAKVACTVHFVKIFIVDAPWDTKVG